MKTYIQHIILATTALVCLAACDKYLDQHPLDFADESAYFKSPDDLKMSVNTFYNMLPRMNANNTGIYSEDNTSDNQIGTAPSNLFYKGDKRTEGTGNWYFTNLRGINFFINTTIARKADGTLTGNEDVINNYLGEGYFFRAYDYFRLLRNYGDVPIVTEMLPDDPYTLREATKRQPRNEVVRFMLEDLDKAISLLSETPLESGRVCRDAALLFKSRVALYEATWERYHAGTCFVPGNAKWPGAAYHPDFAFKAGSAEAEVEFFLKQAIDAADSVAQHRQLDEDYIGMFNSLTEFPNDDEVILARYYKESILSHSCSNYLGRTGAGTGLTRALVNSYLTVNGLPIYAAGNDQYLGDRMPFLELMNRDNRIAQSCKGGGLIYTDETETDTLAYFVPQIHLTGPESATTGYQIKKWVSDVPGQDVYTAGTTASPLMRAAEAYLNYVEAYYELHHSLDSKAKAYWQAIRARAGVSTDIDKTIAATDLSKENDLATHSHGALVDNTLYNIRRERRCEFLAEGMRLDDLKRWRALDLMQEYQVEGINLWEYMYTFYKASTIGEGTVSQKGISNYVRPLQKVATGVAYLGYNFPKQHYLEPIPISEFILTTDATTGESTLYQNPGWPSNADGIADYSYDCD